MTEQFDFSNSVTIAVNFGINPNNQPDFTTSLTGKSTILVGEQVDALVDDPILGNVGTLDDHADVTKVELVSSSSTGSTPFAPVFTATAGDNVADLSPTPSDSELPLESLYSAGANIGDGENQTSEGFLKLFLEITGIPEGTVRNQEPLFLETNPTAENDSQVITYTSSEIIDLYTAGEDGVFWTGDEQKIAKLVPDADGNSVKLELTPIAWDQTSDQTCVAQIESDDDLTVVEADENGWFGENDHDVLVGGEGQDVFELPNLTGKVEIIKDFSADQDLISIMADGLGGNLSADSILASEAFTLGLAAVDCNDRFIFDRASGSLFFDGDGVGETEQVEIARLSPETALSANNIFVDSNGAA